MEMSESSLPIAQQQKPDCSAPIQQNVIFKQWFIELFAKPVQWTNLFTFQSILSLSTIPSTLTHQPGEVLNIITCWTLVVSHNTSTCYPQSIFTQQSHLLYMIYPKALIVEYSQHGKHMFIPYHLSYSNWDMIKVLMSSANEALERSPPMIPHLATMDGKNKRSYICLVGTQVSKTDATD